MRTMDPCKTTIGQYGQNFDISIDKLTHNFVIDSWNLVQKLHQKVINNCLQVNKGPQFLNGKCIMIGLILLLGHQLNSTLFLHLQPMWNLEIELTFVTRTLSKWFGFSSIT